MTTKLKIYEEIPKPNTFKNEHLSVSRVKLFEQCAFAFYCRYVAKMPDLVPERDSSAEFGVVLHAALEQTYVWVIDNWYEGPFPIAEMLAFYREEWTKSNLTGTSLFQEGVDILRNYANTHFRVNHADVLAIEKEFNLKIEEFVVNGYIDQALRIDATTVRVIDYKSNRLLYEKEELESDLQFTIYGLVARELWPWAKTIEFEFRMLRHDKHQDVTRTHQQLVDGGAYIVSLGRRIEHPAQEWKQTVNPYCCYCDARTRCEAYDKMLDGKHPYTKASSKEALDELAKEHYAVNSIAKAAYARKKTIEEALKAKIAKDGEFDAGGFHFKMASTGSMTEYKHPERVVTAFAEVGLDPDRVMSQLMTVSKSAVDELLEGAEKNLPPAKFHMLKAKVDAAATRIPKAEKLSPSKLK